jgi:hypothetical protein
MKSAKIVLAILILSISATGAAFAAGNDVAIVFNKQTEVNREAYNFIRKSFNQQKVNANLVAIKDPSTVKAGTYRAVVVLNTGVATGIDPVLKAFIDGYANKGELILVSLFKGSKDLKVQTMAAKDNPDGIDALSSASLWGSSSAMQMHQEWTTVLGNAIKSRS